jgi:hypothetical protein
MRGRRIPAPSYSLYSADLCWLNGNSVSPAAADQCVLPTIGIVAQYYRFTRSWKLVPPYEPELVRRTESQPSTRAVSRDLQSQKAQHGVTPDLALRLCCSEVTSSCSVITPNATGCGRSLTGSDTCSPTSAARRPITASCAVRPRSRPASCTPWRSPAPRGVTSGGCWTTRRSRVVKGRERSRFRAGRLRP